MLYAFVGWYRWELIPAALGTDTTRAVERYIMGTEIVPVGLKNNWRLNTGFSFKHIALHILSVKHQYNEKIEFGFLTMFYDENNETSITGIYKNDFYKMFYYIKFVYSFIF